MSEEIKNASEAASILATQAAQAAKDLAIKTEQTTNRLSESMGKLSDSVIRLSTNLEYMQKDIGEIKANLSSKYITDESFKPMEKEASDHEKRIRNLERWVTLGLGAVATMDLVLKFFIK